MHVHKTYPHGGLVARGTRIQGSGKLQTLGQSPVWALGLQRMWRKRAYVLDEGRTNHVTVLTSLHCPPSQ